MAIQEFIYLMRNIFYLEFNFEVFSFLFNGFFCKFVCINSDNYKSFFNRWFSIQDFKIIPVKIMCTLRSVQSNHTVFKVLVLPDSNINLSIWLDNLRCCTIPTIQFINRVSYFWFLLISLSLFIILFLLDLLQGMEVMLNLFEEDDFLKILEEYSKTTLGMSLNLSFLLVLFDLLDLRRQVRFLYI